MPSLWTASLTLLDDNQKRTRMTVILGTLDNIDFSTEAGDAETIIEAFLVDLKLLTLANVERCALKGYETNWLDAGVPSSGSDVSEEAAVVCHTNDVGQPLEVDILRIPSPVTGVWFNGNYEEGMDITDSDLGNYVANFETDLEFSDGEHVDVAEGINGIRAGFWRSRKMRVKPPVT